VGRSAWEALDYIPIILVVAIIAALGVVALRLTDTTYKPAIPANAVVAILGTVSALLILFWIVDPPNFGFSEKSGELSRSKERSSSRSFLLWGSPSVAAWLFGRNATPFAH
jgi:amino acid transporter